MADPEVLPGLTAQEVADLAWQRLTETYILDTRVNRIGNIDVQTWKKTYRENQQLYRGDWTWLDPGSQQHKDLPRVQNMLQVGTDDLARLVGENPPDLMSPPLTNKVSDIKAARIREAIAKTHWKKGRGENIKPWLVQDVALAGVCFLAAVHPENKKAYPKPFRIDPAGAYPDVLNGELQDLVVSQRIRKRQAEVLLAKNLDSWAGDSDDIEIIDYYCKGGVIRVLTVYDGSSGPVGEPLVAYRWRYDLDRVPVAMYMLPSADGRFHGFFDQVKGILSTQNRIANLMLDYADQGVYAPWFEQGVTNSTEKPGPGTVYHGMDERSRMERVQPAISSPQLYQMLEFLEMQARAGAARPQSRDGEVDQAIASGSFVNSTQGSNTSQVRSVLRGLANLQEDWHAVAFQLDQKYGNVEKPLWRPVENQYTYKPKRDIGDYYDVEVSYGAGAGLDYLNRKAVIMQEVGAMLVSKDSARAQMDDISDPDGEALKIERETVEQAGLEKYLNAEDPSSLAQLFVLMGKGERLFDALTKVAAQQAEQQQQQQAAMAQSAEGPEGAPATSAPAAPGGAAAPPAGGGPVFAPSAPLEDVINSGRQFG